jgi:hypothetical protein
MKWRGARMMISVLLTGGPTYAQEALEQLEL